MPLFQISDPRHPQSKCRLLHEALLEAFGPGYEIPASKLPVLVKIATGTSATRAVFDYIHDLHDFGMIQWEKGVGATVLPREKRLI